MENEPVVCQLVSLPRSGLILKATMQDALMSPAWQREGASLGSLAGHRGSHGWPVAEAQPSPDQPPGPRVLGRCSLPPSAGRFAPRTQCRLLEDSPELLAQKERGGQYQAPPAVAPAAWQPRARKATGLGKVGPASLWKAVHTSQRMTLGEGQGIELDPSGAVGRAEAGGHPVSL